MTYVKETRKDVAQATKDLEAAVARHGFGVLHTYDLHETLENKGYPIRNACRVLEVCNPRHAQAVLDHDMALNMALPCRISVYEEQGMTRIGMIPPSEILGLVSKSDALRTVAGEVETAIRTMIDEAA
jgi:uncharacterized protein (DUF302 family)